MLVYKNIFAVLEITSVNIPFCASLSSKQNDLFFFPQILQMLVYKNIFAVLEITSVNIPFCASLSSPSF